MAEGLPVLTPVRLGVGEGAGVAPGVAPLVHYAPSHKLAGELRQLSAYAPEEGAGGGEGSRGAGPAR